MYKTKIFYKKKILKSFIKNNNLKDYKYKQYILEFMNKTINNYFLSYKL
jgi:hypothetical protein